MFEQEQVLYIAKDYKFKKKNDYIYISIKLFIF